MRIHKDFTGGNIRVVKQEDKTVFLENELRDTVGDWFYWAFCVEGAQGRKISFKLGNLGPYGPAVSHDLKEWHWLDERDNDGFTYTFKADDTRVYFAHSMLYHPERFYKFAKKEGLCVRELCRGKKGSPVPYVEFGNGERSIILTARHHACESTGNYVLEGVLSELINNPLENTKVFCVPFVDFDGVINGDQGKSRAPYDHNRDYGGQADSIYPETAKIREYADKNGAYYAFDFHSPGHSGGENDRAFIVQSSLEKLDALNLFGEELEKAINKNSLQYSHKDDYPPFTGWNTSSAQFALNMTEREENIVAFTFETTYFGVPDNKVSNERLVELGVCFARALKSFDKKIKGEKL